MPASAAVCIALTNPITPPELPSPEQIVLRAGLADIPSFIAPQPATLFAERALRLRQQAAGHALREYLLLMAVLCEALHERAQTPPAFDLPSADDIAAALQRGEPPLPSRHGPRPALWRAELRAALQQVLARLAPDNPARSAVQTVIAWPDDTLEQQADRLLAGITLGLNMATAPLLAAGLQLHWAQRAAAAAAAHPEAFAALSGRAHCPCCGSLPTASNTRSGQGFRGQRYLHCSVCGSQWRMEMVHCSHCGAHEGIQYQALQPAGETGAPATRAAVEAETCEACHHYLKIVHQERDAHVEPVADDLATLTLDLLVSEAGYQRHGTNLLLLFGDSESVQTEPA